jgi:hypothetical protein
MTTTFSDPRARRIYLAKLEPYDSATGATVSLYVGTVGFVTEPGDTPANTYFEPIMRDALTFERSMFRPGAIGGRSLPSHGDLVLVNLGDFDGWLDYQWDGRAVTVYAGAEGEAWSAFEVVFAGTTGELAYSRDTITVPIVDKQGELDELLEGDHYAGTGGNEGGDDLLDKPKPLCFGEVYNLSPVLVDAANNVYQINDGAIEAVDAVYIAGELKTITTHYTVDLATGLLTMVGTPAGQVTCDVKGDKTGAVYVDTAADIIERLVVTYAGLADPGDLDTAAFTALNTATSAPVGFYTAATARNLLDVLDELVATIGGYFGFTRAGLFTVGRLEAPTGSADLELDEGDLVDDGLIRDSFGPPRWKVRVNYRRSWTIQGGDTLSASVTDAQKEFVAEEWRVAMAEDADVKADGAGKGGHAGAVDPEPLKTMLADQADGDAEAARLLALFKVRRDVFHATVKTQAFAVSIGDQVTLTHSRFGLSAGGDFVVVGIRESATENRVDLDLWG